MAHHSNGGLPKDFFTKADAAKSELAQLLAGPTGKFPQGKLTENDEGELTIAIGHKDGKIVLDFGTPTAWVGFDADQADQIADALRAHAKQVRLGL